jgi:hypothetical protein
MRFGRERARVGDLNAQKAGAATGDYRDPFAVYAALHVSAGVRDQLADDLLCVKQYGMTGREPPRNGGPGLLGSLVATA